MLFEEMQTLFPLETSLPEGFTYQPDFVTPTEEDLLLQEISNFELHPFQFHGYEGKRRVAGFGYDWNFENRTLSKGKEIPKGFDWLLQKVCVQLAVAPAAVSELLITAYPPGAVINWHRDAPPFDLIAGISLLSACDFRLQPPEANKRKRSSILTFRLLPRSLYILRGEAREAWEHSTRPAENLRYSLTVRTLRKSSLK